MSEEVTVARIPLSLPCAVRVVPGTPDSFAPLEERTEFCCVDAFWMLGVGILCDLHFRMALPDLHADALHAYGGELSPRETLPWSEMHRYEQETVNELAREAMHGNVRGDGE